MERKTRREEEAAECVDRLEGDDESEEVPVSPEDLAAAASWHCFWHVVVEHSWLGSFEAEREKQDRNEVFSP